jgi:hypothetical protein
VYMIPGIADSTQVEQLRVSFKANG